MLETSFGFVVVEGPIGVGKTSLAKRLSESFGTELLLEGANENPFLEKFYQKPEQFALQTQLFFLLQRVEQMQNLAQEDLFRSAMVSDYLFQKDRLFAELNLNPHELELYLKVHDALVESVPAPDLVVYLQAPESVLIDRIKKRGINFEQHMGADYLRGLNDLYTRFFYDYNDAPLLIVNAADIDLVNNEADYQLLLEQMGKIKNGRHYFNPTPMGF